VCPVPVLRATRKLEYVELLGLCFLQGAALGIWFVPLSSVLDAHGLGAIKSYAYAASAIAALVSPLFFGAMADRHASPVKVLRGLAFASSITMALATMAIGWRLPPWLVLALIQLFALCAAPTWSISSTVVFSRVADSQREFGPIRAMATVGWMAGCWLVSLLHADATTLAGYSGAVVWLMMAGYTFLLPEAPVPRLTQTLHWRERLGLDALTLLKNRDHRVVFITTALFCIPIAAFYPFAPSHLRDLGLQHTSAWMSLGQVSEIVAMFSLGALLLNWRLKWIFVLGLAFGVLRFAFSAADSKVWLLAGVSLHGVSFTFVFITAQIYLDQRVDKAWRARAQALMSLMNGGVGNLFGFLGAGWWFAACTSGAETRWTPFWGVLAAAVLVVMIYFLSVYQGRVEPIRRTTSV